MPNSGELQTKTVVPSQIITGTSTLAPWPPIKKINVEPVQEINIEPNPVIPPVTDNVLDTDLSNGNSIPERDNPRTTVALAKGKLQKSPHIPSQSLVSGKKPSVCQSFFLVVLLLVVAVVQKGKLHKPKN
jgi:hypothetical protein